MPQVDREGIFKVAAGGQHALEESKDGAVAVAIKFKLTHKLEGEDWQPWDQYGQDVWSRLWIIKKDKSANETAVTTLRDVLGWDGDVESIGNERWTLPACQVNVKNDKYDGKDRFKAEWINPIDYVPDNKPKTAPPEKVKAIKSQFGAQLRAIYGTKTVSTPAPSTQPAPLPSLAKKTATLPPPPVASKGVHGTKARAWSAFCESNLALSNPHGPERLEAEWLRIYSQFFADREEGTLTSQEWLKMEKEGPAEMTPF